MKINYLNKNTTESDYYPRSEKVIIFAIAASIAFPMVDGLVNRFFQIEFWDSFFTKGTYYLSLLFATYYAFKRFKKEMVTLPLLVLGLSFFSFIAFPVNRGVLISEIFLPLITIILPLFIITLSVKDYKRLYSAIRIASYIVVISAFIYLNLQFEGELEIGYMEFSYNMSLSVMFLIIIAFRKRRLLDIIMAFAGFTIIFMSGSRGAMFGILTGIVTYIFLNLRFNIRNSFIITPIIFLIIFINTHFMRWLDLINTGLLSININSRNINLLLNKEVENSSGRDLIFNQSLNLMADNWFTGIGMAGDRPAIGSYTHNLFTEFLVEYGLILGSVFSIILFFYLINSFFQKRKDELYYLFFSVFFSTGFMKLQFSGSYLQEPTFFMLLALSSLLLKRRRNTKII